MRVGFFAGKQSILAGLAALDELPIDGGVFQVGDADPLDRDGLPLDGLFGILVPVGRRGNPQAKGEGRLGEGLGIQEGTTGRGQEGIYRRLINNCILGVALTLDGPPLSFLGPSNEVDTGIGSSKISFRRELVPEVNVGELGKSLVRLEPGLHQAFELRSFVLLGKGSLAVLFKNVKYGHIQKLFSEGIPPFAEKLCVKLNPLADLMISADHFKDGITKAIAIHYSAADCESTESDGFREIRTGGEDLVFNNVPVEVFQNEGDTLVHRLEANGNRPRSFHGGELVYQSLYKDKNNS